jgi:hypothetical protein
VGSSLFQIAKSLIALYRFLISAAKSDPLKGAKSDGAIFEKGADKKKERFQTSNRQNMRKSFNFQLRGRGQGGGLARLGSTVYSEWSAAKTTYKNIFLTCMDMPETTNERIPTKLFFQYIFVTADKL